LIYVAITSLDGFVADVGGDFDWAAPDDEVLGFVNELERPIGTHLYGRRMYELMRYWETAGDFGEEQQPMQDFAEIWRAADKIVVSSTLATPSSERTQIMPTFDASAVRQLKADRDRDITVGGPNLAAQVFRAGLVDECHLFLTPIVVGGGKPGLPDGVRMKLVLLDDHRFANGVVYLHYRTGT
jgi:dihydrofolate reductase